MRVPGTYLDFPAAWEDFVTEVPGSTDVRYEETITRSGRVAVHFSGQMSLVRSALYGLSAGLIVFPNQEFHQLLDIGIHQVNAQHVAGLGPHPHDEIFRADTVDNQETAVVASNRERSGAILHTLT